MRAAVLFLLCVSRASQQAVWGGCLAVRDIPCPAVPGFHHSPSSSPTGLHGQQDVTSKLHLQAPLLNYWTLRRGGEDRVGGSAA